jgi:hypothetical protein
MAAHADSLSIDYSFFEANRSEWANQHRDEFVLVCKRALVGFYETYEDAYKAGLQTFGVKSQFLVKQVSAVEPVFFIY